MNTDPTFLYVDDLKSGKVMQLIFEVRMGLTRVTYLEDSENFKARVLDLTPRPDIVFLDIRVKPITGFEMLEILRQLPEFSDIPVVALTTSVMNQEVHQLKQTGFDNCLAKPIDMEAFPGIVKRILGGEKVWRIIG